jgi:hypothetical protein
MIKKFVFLQLIILITFQCKILFAQQVEWLTHYNDTTNSINTILDQGMCIDNNNNIIHAFHSSRIYNLSSSIFQFQTTTIQKLNTYGNLQWEYVVNEDTVSQNRIHIRITSLLHKFLFIDSLNQINYTYVGIGDSSSTLARDEWFIGLIKLDSNGNEVLNTKTEIPFGFEFTNGTSDELIRNRDRICYFPFDKDYDSIRIEILDENANPLYSFVLDDNEDFYGDLNCQIADSFLYVSYNETITNLTQQNVKHRIVKINIYTGLLLWNKTDVFPNATGASPPFMFLLKNDILIRTSKMARYDYNGDLIGILPNIPFAYIHQLEQSNRLLTINFSTSKCCFDLTDSNFSFIQSFTCDLQNCILSLTHQQTKHLLLRYNSTTETNYIDEILFDGTYLPGNPIPKIRNNYLAPYIFDNIILDHNGDFIIKTFDNELFTQNDRGVIMKICANCSPTISGNVYMDLNSNCLHDTLVEPLLEGELIKLKGKNLIASSDSNGRYSFITNSVVDTLELLSSDVGVNCLASNALPYSAGLNTSYDIGILPSYFYNATCKFADGISRPGFSNTISLDVKNISANSLTNGWAELYLDQNFTYVSSNPLIDSSSNGSLFWKLDSLNPGKNMHFVVEVYLPTSVSINTIYKHDLAVYRNSDTFCNKSIVSLVFGSYDPNEMNLLPILENPENCIENDSLLTYRIDFQNTGNDTAFNIKVINYPDHKLDLSAFEIIGNSHTMYTELKNNQIIFKFPNINLVDSHKSYFQSCGYIIYSCRIKKGVLNETVSNYSDIYFDFNEPIRTNELRNFIGDCNPIKYETNLLSVYPNPTNSNEIGLSIYSLTNQFVDVRIFNLQSQLCHPIHQIKVEKGLNNKRLSIGNLASGMYVLKVKIGDEFHIIKFLKN